MPLPIVPPYEWSKGQLKKLSKCLLDDTKPADGLPEWGDVLVWFEELAANVRDWVDGFDWAKEAGLRSPVVATSRAKSRDTLREKLLRSPEFDLTTIRDVAGVRLVADMTLPEQDHVANRLVEVIGTENVRVVDRRAEPSGGYRALHLEIRLSGWRVELQIRTVFQHDWAELFERLADTLGRQIRYGGHPVGEDQQYRRQMVSFVEQLSVDAIAGLELREADPSAMHELMGTPLAEARQKLRTQMGVLRSLVAAL